MPHRLHSLRATTSLLATTALVVLSACGPSWDQAQVTSPEREAAAGGAELTDEAPPDVQRVPPPADQTPASGEATDRAEVRTVEQPRTPARVARRVAETGWAPFAEVAGIVLTHPAARVELTAFHESNHDGARDLGVLATAAHPFLLESRQRGTGARSAADIVVDPEAEIRSPVSGTVVRGGSYVLYCDHRDEYAVISPDAQPGWEVKVLHVHGLRVRPGDRVEAGVTVLAAGSRVLPFRSQVDDETAEPSWPHVHLEVVDPSIPDRPSEGGGC